MKTTFTAGYQGKQRQGTYFFGKQTGQHFRTLPVYLASN